ATRFFSDRRNSCEFLHQASPRYTGDSDASASIHGTFPMNPTSAAAPQVELIAEAQCTEERFLRHIFVRDQMQEWSKAPLVMARADGVHYWDVHGKRYLDAPS